MVSTNPIGPRKDGGPNIEFFQSAESMAGFETVRLWLMKNCKKVRIPTGLVFMWGRVGDELNDVC